MPSPDLGNRVEELASRLVAIDSVSPSLAPGSAGEAEIALFLSERLERAGFTVSRVDTGDLRRPSLIAVRDGARPGPSVAFNGHLDTVPVEGMSAPFVPRVEGGRMSGRGSSDMKGGIAGLVVAAEELAARNTPGRLIVALVADEEDASSGAEAVLARLDVVAGRPDLCLIAEPTWLDIAEAHRGFELMKVVVAGRAAHSSQPNEGSDVVPVVAELLTALVARDAELASVPHDPELGPGSLMATVVRAGSAPFTIPARAEILVERRTVLSESADAGSRDLRTLLAEMTLPEGVSASVESVTRRSAWRLGSSGAAADFAALLAEALTQRSEAAPKRRSFPYWMESALWEGAGVPTVVCGPAGGGLHAVDEWMDLAQLRLFPGAVVDAVTRFVDR